MLYTSSERNVNLKIELRFVSTLSNGDIKPILQKLRLFKAPTSKFYPAANCFMYLRMSGAKHLP